MSNAILKPICKFSFDKLELDEIFLVRIKSPPATSTSSSCPPQILLLSLTSPSSKQRQLVKPTRLPTSHEAQLDLLYRDISHHPSTFSKVRSMDLRLLLFRNHERRVPRRSSQEERSQPQLLLIPLEVLHRRKEALLSLPKATTGATKCLILDPQDSQSLRTPNLDQLPKESLLQLTPKTDTLLLHPSVDTPLHRTLLYPVLQHLLLLNMITLPLPLGHRQLRSNH